MPHTLQPKPPPAARVSLSTPFLSPARATGDRRSPGPPGHSGAPQRLLLVRNPFSTDPVVGGGGRRNDWTTGAEAAPDICPPSRESSSGGGRRSGGGGSAAPPAGTPHASSLNRGCGGFVTEAGEGLPQALPPCLMRRRTPGPHGHPAEAAARVLESRRWIRPGLMRRPRVESTKPGRTGLPPPSPSAGRRGPKIWARNERKPCLT